MFRGQTLLITGGTGSFGTAVLQRFLQTDIGEIRIFSRDEKKQEDVRKQFLSPKIRFHIGNVREASCLTDAMRGVDFVLHAVGLKQVPSGEFFPMEALKTNTFGTENVMNAAIAAGVKRMIVLSSDKAVYPVSAMGMTQGLMEKLALAKSRMPGHDMVISVVRLGSVMASRGSVIPLFIRQIQDGRTMTITEPHMTRFMMTMDEAVNMVTHAFQSGLSGDLFVPRVPACSIEVLAQAVRKLLDADIPVDVIGARHGEKLHETLLSSEEMAFSEDLGHYFRLPADKRDLSYSPFLESGRTSTVYPNAYKSSDAQLLDVVGMSERLLQLDCMRRAMSGVRITL